MMQTSASRGALRESSDPLRRLDSEDFSKEKKRARAPKCPSLGSSPLPGRSPMGSPMARSVSQSFEDKLLSQLPRHSPNEKIPSQPLKRSWVTAVFLASLLLAALCSLLVFSLFASRLARLHQPLVLLDSGGERLVVKFGQRAEKADPLEELRHPHLAGRKELLRYFEEKDQGEVSTEQRSPFASVVRRR